jgi:hypothetical protein
MQGFIGTIRSGTEGIASAVLFLSNQTVKEFGMSNSTLPTNPSAFKLCSVEGCRNKHNSKGFCRKHYLRMQRRGSVEPTRIYYSDCSVLGCSQQHKSHGLCDKHYARFRRNGDSDIVGLRMGRGETAEARFWSRVAVTANDEKCWEWQFGTGSFGYGTLSFRGKKYRAHQVAWFFVKGFFSKKCLLHSCDNPLCVNPNHLREGTRTENNQDAVLRNRQARGERTGQAKLNAEKVTEIRRLLANGKTQRFVAQKFGIAEHTVWNIKNYKTWTHI